MAARQKFFAGLLHQIEALRLTADVFEGWVHAWRGLLHFFSAVSARGGDVLVTGLTHVIRLRLALRTEVFLAVRASDPEIGHVLGCLFGQRLSFVILLPFDNFARNKFHDISALAANEVRVEFHDLKLLGFFDLLLLLLVEVLVQLVGLQDLSATRAVHLLVVGHQSDGVIFEAVNVNLVEAFTRLQEGLVTVLLFFWRDLPVTEFAHAFFCLLLDLLVVSLGSLAFGLRHEAVDVHISVDLDVWRDETLVFLGRVNHIDVLLLLLSFAYCS